jgi:hypothetical protein
MRGFFLAVATVWIVWNPSALAGSVNLVWDASAGATGYKVYSRSDSGEYGAGTNVGNTTQTTYLAMADCTATVFAVKAYNAAGESGFSDEVSTWPRPELNGLMPLDGQKGSTLDVVIAGNNFEPGASVLFSGSGITVNSVTRNACAQLTANITISDAAAFGPRDVRVVNTNGVTGVAPGAFTVVGTPLPEVQNLRRTDTQP